MMEIEPSSTVPQQQPEVSGQTVMEIKTEVESSDVGVNSIENRQVSSQTVSPHRRPEQESDQTVMIDNRNGTFFSADGLQYSVATDDDDSVQEFGGVFSYDEVYAMMDPSNSAATDPNVGDTSNNCQGFIPVGGSDMRQLLNSIDSSGGADSSTSADGEIGPAYNSNGPFFRIISLTNNNEGNCSNTYDTTLDASSTMASNGGPSCPVNKPLVDATNSGTPEGSSFGGNSASNGGDGRSSNVLDSPARGGVVVSVESGAGQQSKVRKPRGRKPKHVKEAEAALAAAAAAAAALTSTNSVNSAGNSEDVNLNSSPPRHSNVQSSGRDPKRAIFREPTNDIFPNATTIRRQQEAIGSQQHVVTTNVATSTSPISRNSQQQQQQPNAYDNSGSGQQKRQHHCLELPSSSEQTLSLEQLAHHDRRVILTARRHNVNSYVKGCTIIENDYIHYDRQHYNPHYQSYRNAPLGSPPPQSTNGQSGPASNYRPAGHTNRDTGARLDQFFSSRIAAPSNRTIVKPRIIQENKGIYKLLTTPRTGSSTDIFDNRKLSQERWMQTPNPSIVPEDDGCGGDRNGSTGESSQGTTMHFALDPRTAANKQFHLQQQQHATSSGIPQQRYIIGSNSQGRINIRRDGASIPMGATTTSAGVSAPHGVDSSGQGYHHHVPSQNNIRSSSSSHPIHMDAGGNGSGFNSRYINQIHELQLRLESSAQDNFELKCRVNHLKKVKRQLMLRLKQSYEQNEDLKMYLLQNSQFPPNNLDKL